MIRKKKQPDLILTSDWHIREDAPICRTDFQKEQWEAVDFVANLQCKHNCPVLHAGDLFNYWKPSPWLLSKTIIHLPKKFYTVYGNHDLPQHNLNLQEKSGIYTLEQADIVNGITPKGMQFLSWGMVPFENDDDILVWHRFTWQGTRPWPGCVHLPAIELLKKHSRFNLILTGDNHVPFVEERKGKILVNPGPLTIQKADETNLPRVYLWYSDTNMVEPVYLPYHKETYTREHLDKVEARNERIEIFVNSLNTKFKAALSFEDNLEQFEKENSIRKSVMEIVYKSIGK